MHIFCGLTPTEKFQIRPVTPQAKLILKINQGKGYTSAKFAQHTKEAHINFQRFTVSTFLKCLFAYDSCNFILALFVLCWDNKKIGEQLKKGILFKKKSLLEKKSWNKWWQAFQDPCSLKLWTRFSLKQGCEQQILEKKFFQHSLNIPRVFVVH